MDNIQKELESCWSQKMIDFEKRLNALTVPNNPSLSQLREEFQEFKELVTKMINLLGQQIRANTKTIDIMDMRGRQKMLLFNGISEDTGIDVEQKILGILQTNMGLTQVSSSNIKRCHRLGSGGGNHVPPVLVHFSNHQIKAEVWNSKAKLKGSSITILEFLTKPRQIVHRRARRHFGMRNVWTLDGTIHIKLPGGQRVKIITEEELDSLFEKYPVPVTSEAMRGADGTSDDRRVNQQPISQAHRQQNMRSKQCVPGVHTDDPKRSRRAPIKK